LFSIDPEDKIGAGKGNVNEKIFFCAAIGGHLGTGGLRDSARQTSRNLKRKRTSERSVAIPDISHNLH
jgi:hypothetical protein